MYFLKTRKATSNERMLLLWINTWPHYRHFEFRIFGAQYKIVIIITIMVVNSVAIRIWWACFFCFIEGFKISIVVNAICVSHYSKANKFYNFEYYIYQKIKHKCLHSMLQLCIWTYIKRTIQFYILPPGDFPSYSCNLDIENKNKIFHIIFIFYCFDFELTSCYE